MTQGQISKELFKIIRPSDCWHEIKVDPDENNIICICGGWKFKGIEGFRLHVKMHNPNYFSKEGFWDVWEWARKQDWWELFEQRHDGIPDRRFYALHLSLIDYKTFARHLHAFLVQEGIVK